MAAEDGNPSDLLDDPESLEARSAPLLKVAHRSDFFNVVGLIERLCPDAIGVGGEGPVADEAIRFQHDGDLSFSAGDITSVALRKLPKSLEDAYLPSKSVFEVTTTFLGLTGASSPLPLYIAEEILHEEDNNPVQQRFLDIFHHRLISLLYRTVIRCSPGRSHVSGRRDEWMQRGLWLGGLDPEIQGSASKLPLPTLVRLIPLLSGRGRGERVLTLTLREILGDCLDRVPEVKIKQFAGGWVEVDSDQQWKLGTRNTVLGEESILGARAWDRSGRFLIELGPLSKEEYRRFLNEGDLVNVLSETVRLANKESLDYDLDLVLEADAVPSFILSSSGTTLLGRDTRLGSAEGQREVIHLGSIEEAA